MAADAAGDTNLLLPSLGILVLLLLSGFFSGSETALTAASRAAMHDRERQGDRRAGLVNALLSKRDRLIGAILLGNNLVNILASTMAASVLIQVFGDAGVAYATLVMTLLILIFAEILPKTYAINNPDRMARAVAPIVRVLVVVLAPITHAIDMLVRAVLRLLGAQPDSGETMTVRLAELRGLIEMNRDESVRQERAMLRSVLDLANVEVCEVMTHRKKIAQVDADLPPREIIERVLQSPYSRVPLWQGEPDNVVGVLHARDLLHAVARRCEELDDLDMVALASRPWFVPDTTSLLAQLQAFRERREHFALVVDEYGALQGVVTLEDILEEIVGDIADEHDLPVHGVRAEEGGSLLVDGSVTIRDLNRDHDWDLPDEHATTIAGLVLHEAREIPLPGQQYTFHGFRFEVVKRHRHQITQLRITPPADGETG